MIYEFYLSKIEELLGSDALLKLKQTTFLLSEAFYVIRR